MHRQHTAKYKKMIGVVLVFFSYIPTAFRYEQIIIIPYFDISVFICWNYTVFNTFHLRNKRKGKRTSI